MDRSFFMDEIISNAHRAIAEKGEAFIKNKIAIIWGIQESEVTVKLIKRTKVKITSRRDTWFCEKDQVVKVNDRYNFNDIKVKYNHWAVRLVRWRMKYFGGKSWKNQF